MGLSTDTTDVYEILQVHPKADAELISIVYRHLAKKYHPDVAPSHLRTNYEERMKQINEAYAVVSDPDRRRNFDCCRPNQANDPDTFLLRFENAAVLAEAAVAGGGRDECYRRAARILQSVVQAASETELEYEALIRLAEIQYKGLQDYQAAASTFERMAQRTPKGPDLDEILVLIIDCHCQSQNWQLALRACDRAGQECTLPGTMAVARVNRGDVLDNLQRFDEATKAFAVVVQTYPGTEEAAYAQYRLARILDSGMQRYREAIEAYRAVLRDYRSSQWAQDCQWRIDHIQRKHIDKKAWWE